MLNWLKDLYESEYIRIDKRFFYVLVFAGMLYAAYRHGYSKGCNDMYEYIQSRYSAKSDSST